ncbi:MAG: cohesin domain-containing protein [Desulfobacter sp.]
MKQKTIVIAVCAALICVGVGFGAIKLFGTGSGTASAVSSIHEGDSGQQPNSVYVTTDWQEDGVVDVTFNVNQADAGAVFAAVMNFSYSGKDLEYVSYEEGNYFDQAGSAINKKKPVYLVSAKPVSSSTDDGSDEYRLAVGVSLFKGSPGMNGSGRLITLKFRAKHQTASQIILTKKKLVGTDAKELTQISWPGAVRITPA